MGKIELGPVAFSMGLYRGFTLKATYLKQEKQNALIEIFREGILYQEFFYPAYRIYNIAAHFEEMVDEILSEMEHGN